MRLFRSATCPSVWQAHRLSSLFALLALAAGLAVELADRYVTRREHSVQSTTSHAIP
jgi:hypothetical protein